MKLVPEQISELRKEEKKAKEALSGYSDYLTSKEITSTEGCPRALIGDSLIDQQYSRDRQHSLEISTLLLDSDYVVERTTDKIDIGTKFVIEYAKDTESQTMLLTEHIFGLAYDSGFISIESPIGKAVRGKKEGDSFKAEVITGRLPSERRNILGKVIEIKSDPKDYLHFIRENKEKNRICTLAREERKNLLNSTSTEAQEEYAKRQNITESQRQLLIIELTRLSRKASTSDVRARVAHIRRLLATTKVAIPPTDGTIGIGTSFDIFITDGEQSETRHYEMINRAVSDELEDAYVERIDTLGSKLYGLRQNDIIKYRKDGKTYKVAIMNVEVSNKEKDKNDSIQKQYTKKSF